MRNAITVAWAIGLLVTRITLAHAASDDTPGDYCSLPAADLKVRIYNAAVVPATDQAVALRAAASVLAAAGIGTTWLLCGNVASDPAAEVCSTPLDPSELSVRLVRLPATASSRGELQLGYSLVDTTARAGTLATIYADRVAWLAGEAGADMPTLVGFAIAHEIGHLLLGTNAHAGSGLMRAVWSRAELRRNDTADWLFGRSEATRLRASVLRLEGLRSSQPDFNAAACSASVDVASDSAADASECPGGGGAASIRAMAAGADRRSPRTRLHR